MLLVFLSIVGNATNYYVAADGNDSNVGTSSATPFLTLTKISQLTSSNYIQSGDKIFLRKGDIFRGTLYLEYYENNNIQILAYGSGSKPIIKGSEIVTNWLSVGTNLWVATISQAPKEVYANGTTLTCARYPNSGFLFVDTGAAASLAPALSLRARRRASSSPVKTVRGIGSGPSKQPFLSTARASPVNRIHAETGARS